jgi:hypothetical protein
MSTSRILSQALILAAMHLTPGMAHENAAAHRYLPAGAATVATNHVEGHAGMSAPHVGVFIAAPGASCDVGDTARIC